MECVANQHSLAERRVVGCGRGPLHHNVFAVLRRADNNKCGSDEEHNNWNRSHCLLSGLEFESQCTCCFSFICHEIKRTAQSSGSPLPLTPAGTPAPDEIAQS